MAKRVSTPDDERQRLQREAIVELAHERFRRHGIRKVTLGELARELRISKKTLYAHFADKEALVRACIEKVAGTVLPVMSAALDGPGTPVERMVGVWRAAATFPRLISPELAADLQADYPAVWREVAVRRQAVLARLEQLIDQGRRAGEIHAQVHPKAATAMLMAIVNQVLVPEVIARGEFSPAEAVQTLMTLMVRGLFVEPPAPEEIVR